MRYDILQSREKGQKVEYNWVTSLPVYQIIYNSGYHKAIGNMHVHLKLAFDSCMHGCQSCVMHAGMTPFELLFGRAPKYNSHDNDCESIVMSQKIRVRMVETQRYTYHI